jgi:hypothetical protein
MSNAINFRTASLLRESTVNRVPLKLFHQPDTLSGGCYIVHERIRTRYGERVRPVEVCG